MPKQIFLAAAVLSLGGCHFSAQADTGPSIDRGYTVAGFTGLSVAGPYDVVVHSGPTVSVRATGSEKSLDRMTVAVKDGVLTIGSEKHSGWSWGWSKSGPVKLEITVPNLSAASIAGSGEVNIDRVTGPNFKGDIAGSGDLTLAAVDASELDLLIAGSGGIKATGKAEGQIRHRRVGRYRRQQGGRANRDGVDRRVGRDQGSCDRNRRRDHHGIGRRRPDRRREMLDFEERVGRRSLFVSDSRRALVTC